MAYGEVTSVNISGVILAPPPCVINGSKVIDVDFGNQVMTNLVDGNNYLQTVNYSVVCNNAPSNSMRMQIKGDKADFSTTALKTNNNDLGIELLLEGNKYSGWFNFTYPTLPKLEAVPVKRSGSILETGLFEGAATLVVEYR
ncbi:fimbrial protein [Yersinia mollaretii]|uniref:Exported pilin protein n=1 Tax=Yersinia mollaretii TaxID=33060 RepID=A0AA36PM97_YERMO|nr:fimbrial protein [Yersinia mollaretii]MDA5526201.1 fimbrial protein [Yersinia mollaretii]MDA5535846.1 fimbrial protein [Yersinia mollaretii]MDN0111219.1 fimbrial protein [Yersinia mollaretii]MDR7873207.1 fimbrial protein [Yersinia mollaretii]NIL03924.1 fimbrial protein [Yersinia mollaretii]